MKSEAPRTNAGPGMTAPAVPSVGAVPPSRRTHGDSYSGGPAREAELVATVSTHGPPPDRGYEEPAEKGPWGNVSVEGSSPGWDHASTDRR